MSRCRKKLKIPIFHAHVTILSGTIESETRKYQNDVWLSLKVGCKTHQYHQTVSAFWPLAAVYGDPASLRHPCLSDRQPPSPSPCN